MQNYIKAYNSFFFYIIESPAVTLQNKNTNLLDWGRKIDFLEI